MYILKQNVGDRWRNFYWLPVEILRTLVIKINKKNKKKKQKKTLSVINKHAP